MSLNITNCTFLNITNNLSTTNCSFSPLEQHNNEVGLATKIFVYTFLGILSIFLTAFVCLIGSIILDCIKNYFKKNNNNFLYCFRCCLKKPHTILYKQNMYDFSVKNCTLINPKLIKDELIIDTDCSICLDKLINLSDPKSQEKILKINMCEHQFHVECIYSWFNTRFSSEHIIDCPLCRTEIGHVSITIPRYYSNSDNDSVISYSDY
jgi:hypothetical protein